MPAPVEEKKRAVEAALHGVLRPAGFRKRGSTFVRELAGITQVVALQSSSKTTVAEVLITVNLAVMVPAALHSWEPPISVWSGHWRARLGELSPGATDLWWSITDPESASAAARQIAALTRDFALPELAKLSSIEALLETLDREAALGLTATEQVNAAARIRQMASRH
jgi:hypothetical protein